MSLSGIKKIEKTETIHCGLHAHQGLIDILLTCTILPLIYSQYICPKTILLKYFNEMVHLNFKKFSLLQLYTPEIDTPWLASQFHS